MKHFDSDEFYTVEINGIVYKFQYANPDSHDNGKSFSGSAYVINTSNDQEFTVFASVRADEIDEYVFKIISKIEAHEK